MMDIIWPLNQSVTSILFIVIEIKLIYCPSYVIFTIKFMYICNDLVKYDKIISNL